MSTEKVTVTYETAAEAVGALLAVDALRALERLCQHGDRFTVEVLGGRDYAQVRLCVGSSQREFFGATLAEAVARATRGTEARNR